MIKLWEKNRDLTQGRVRLVPRDVERIYWDTVPDGSSLEFFDGAGKKYFSLKKNPPSNSRKSRPVFRKVNQPQTPAPQGSFTMTFENGHEIILPEGAFFQTETFKLKRENEDEKCDANFLREALPEFPLSYLLEIKDDSVIFTNTSKEDMAYTVAKVEEEKTFSFAYENKKSLEIPEAGCEVELATDKYAAIYDENGNLAGAIYAVEDEGKKHYVFRDINRTQAIKMTGDREFFMPADETSDIYVHAKVAGGKLFLFPDNDISYNVVTVNHKWQADMGKDSEVSGLINGGRKFYAATFRELGENHKYETANESNAFAGLSNGVLGVLDGLGGNGHGDKASYKAATSMLADKGSLYGLVQQAHDELYFFNRYLLLNSQPHCDTVFAGVRVTGDSYEGVSLGDARWVHLRKGQIIAKSPNKSLLGEYYEQGMIPKYTLMTSADRTIVNTTLVVGCEPDVRRGKLEPGDILVLFDDGVAIDFEFELAEIAQMVKSPEEFGKELIKRTTERNASVTQKFVAKDENGIEFEVDAPCDNVALAVYYHD